jgi:hypothetical protein
LDEIQGSKKQGSPQAPLPLSERKELLSPSEKNVLETDLGTVVVEVPAVICVAVAEFLLVAL